MPIDFTQLGLEEAPTGKDVQPYGEAPKGPLNFDDMGLEESTPGRLRTLYNQMRTNPNTERRVIDFSERTGIPQETVRNRLQEAERIANEPDWDSLYEKSPELAKQFQEDYDLFRAGHDDLDNLSALDMAIRGQDPTAADTSGAGRYGMQGMQNPGAETPESIRRIPSAAYSGVPRMAASFYQYAGDLLSIPSYITKPMMDAGLLPADPFGAMAQSSYEEAQRQRNAAEHYMGSMEGLNTTEQAILQGFASIPQSVATAGLAASGAPLVPTLTTLFGAPQYEQSLQDARAAGLSRPEQLLYATVSAAAEVGTEFFPELKFIGSLKAGDPFFKTLGKMAVNETWTEQVNTAVSSFNDWAHLHPEQPFSEFIQEMPERAYMTLVATLTTMGATTGAGYGMSRISGLYGSEKEQAVQSEAWRNRMREISQIAKQSKLATESPSKFKQVVGKMVEQSGTDSVYINANDFNQYFQDQGVNPVEVATTLGVNDQLPGAIVNNGDIRIPASEFISHFATNPLADGMIDLTKPSPEAMSAKEAEEWTANEGERFQELADRIARENATDEAWQASTDQIAQDLAGQIVATGRFDQATAEKLTAPVTAFYQVLADRLGMQPHEAYQKYGLQVRGEPIVSDFDQEQTNLQKFLEGSVVQEPVYHSTPSTFTVFDTDINGGAHFGTAAAADEANKFAKEITYSIEEDDGRFYVIPDNGDREGEDIGEFSTRKEAAAFIRTQPRRTPLMKVYLSIKNPKRVEDAGTGRGWMAEREKAEAEGYDGLVYRNEVEDNGKDSYVAFYPEQIKSATDNRGTFDPNDPNILNQPAFHGSPHQFTEFDLSKIGTGEGAQAYGWGIYLAEDPEVAGHYQTKLSTIYDPEMDKNLSKVITYKGKSVDIDKSFQDLTPDELALVEIGIYDGSPYQALDSLRSWQTEDLPADQIKKYKDAADWLDSRVDSIKNDIKFESGAFYEVDLPDEQIAKMLDWDAPLSEQPESVRELFEPLVVARLEEMNARKGIYTSTPEKIIEKMTGGEWYDLLAADGGQKVASETLSEAGIPGIKYWDGGSRKAANGTRNFVIFDPSIARIVSRNGQPIEEFYQQNRGAIQFNPDAATIALFEGADLSTFLHEAGHFFFETYKDVASQPDAPQQVKDDMQALLDFVGVDTLETWNGMTVEQRRDGHEKVARAFEAYLFEGNAPSTGMRSLFRTFAQWLKQLYRSLKALNVELTPEVRGVFDRMLASEEEIKTVEIMKQYAPLFESIEQAGMTPEEWADYRGMAFDSTEQAEAELAHRSLRDMRWLTNAKGRELKRLQKEAKAKRASVRKEAEERIYGQPLYGALRFITHGDREPIIRNSAARKLAAALLQGHTKLSKEALVEMYGKDPEAPWRYLPTGKYGVMASEGIHPNEVAELFGLESGDALVRGILSAPPPEQAIEELTDRLTMQRYGDLSNPAVLDVMADQAVHNEARLKFFATELKALDNLANVRADSGEVITYKSKSGETRTRRKTYNVLDKAARDYAEAAIGRKTVRDAPRTAEYAAAETRAGKLAAQAMRKGDVPQAAEHKRAQLLNAHFFRAASKAGDEIDRILRYLKKFDNAGTRKNLSQDYLDQIDKLLERYDLRASVSRKDVEKRAALKDWIESQRERGFDPVIPDKLQDEINRQHYSTMTLDELRGLRDAVKSIDHLGRVKQKLLTAKDQREFDAIIEEAVASIEKYSKGRKPVEIETDLPQDKLKKTVGEFFASHRKLADILRMMDGYQDGGAMWSLLMRPLNAAMDREAALKEESAVFLAEQFAKLQKGGKLYQKENVPGVGQLTRQARISVALNLGNDVNRQRLTQTQGWSPDQIDEIVSTLTKDDWDFVQAIWDHINSFWPEIEAKEKRVNGVAPEKVQPTPVQTPYGEYPGGYYPIKYNRDASPRAYKEATAEAAKDALRGAWARATTRRGHLKARVEEVKNRKMRLDFSPIFEHMEQVIHDLSLHEYLIDEMRIMNDPRVEAAILENYGSEYYRQITDAMTAVAAGDVPAVTVADRAANWMRTGASIAGMGWKMTTALLQPLGLTQSIQRIGVKWVGRGLKTWLSSSQDMEGTYQWIISKSTMMRLRGKTLQREINEVRNRIQKESWFQDQLNKAAQAVGSDKAPDISASYFYLIVKMQLVADIPTWLGQYEKSMAQGVDEPTAIALADQAVLDAQGGGQIKDLAGIQRGSPFFKLWTNFYSYFNVTYNRTAEAFGRTDWKSVGSVGQLGTDLVNLYILPSVLASLMYEALRGRCSGDWDCIAERIAGDQVSYILGTVVGVREVASMFSGYGYQGPAGARVFESLVRFGKQASQMELDEAFFKAANQASGALLHYPAGQVEYTLDGMYSIITGETANPAALVFGGPR